MGLNFKSLSTEREWRSSTGLSQSDFDKLVHWFGMAYKSVHEVSIEEAQLHMGRSFIFATYDSLLFFVLFSLKNPTTFDVNGLIFGISQTAAEYHFRRGLKVLHRALELSGQMPRQDFKDLCDFQSALAGHECLKIDVTEVLVHRPQNKMLQKARYSGKKSTIAANR